MTLRPRSRAAAAVLAVLAGATPAIAAAPVEPVVRHVFVIVVENEG